MMDAERWAKIKVDMAASRIMDARCFLVDAEKYIGHLPEHKNLLDKIKLANAELSLMYENLYRLSRI